MSLRDERPAAVDPERRRDTSTSGIRGNMTDANAKDLIAQARRPETTVDLCLRGDLSAEWERLERRLDEAGKRRKLTDSGASDAAAEMAQLETQMAESTIALRLRALPRRDWMTLVGKHPPREGDDVDGQMGINRDTFYDALIHASVVEPELTGEEIDELLDAITSRQFDALFEAAWGLNRRDVSVPFSRAASRITSSSGETSRRQSGSGSATGGSAGGKRAKKPSTSTTTKDS